VPAVNRGLPGLIARGSFVDLARPEAGAPAHTPSLICPVCRRPARWGAVRPGGCPAGAPYRTNELDTPGPDCSASPGSSVDGTDQLAQPPHRVRVRLRPPRHPGAGAPPAGGLPVDPLTRRLGRAASRSSGMPGSDIRAIGGRLGR